MRVRAFHAGIFEGDLLHPVGICGERSSRNRFINHDRSTGRNMPANRRFADPPTESFRRLPSARVAIASANHRQLVRAPEAESSTDNLSAASDSIWRGRPVIGDNSAAISRRKGGLFGLNVLAISLSLKRHS